MSDRTSATARLLGVWRQAWRHREFRTECLGTFGCLLLSVFLLSVFLRSIEMRHGVVLPDPILSLFSAVDLTWPTFALIYAAILFGLGNLSRFPYRLLLALQSYILLVCIRMAMMYVVPLDPPVGMVPLRDPFVEFFGTGRLLERDLVFSGHTATLILLALTAPESRTQYLFFICSLSVAVFLLWQHVHYTIDVLAAPFVAYASYRFVLLSHRRIMELSKDRNWRSRSRTEQIIPM